MTSSVAENRRTLNKQATRQAIVTAALEILRQSDNGGLTATGIAEKAGISRRTLFNYFPSVDAVLCEPLQSLLNGLVDSLNGAPTDQPLIKSVAWAMKAPAVTELLAPVAQIAVYAKHADDGLLTVSEAAWQQSATAVISEVAARHPQASDFVVRVFAHAVLGAGQAAFDEWIDRLVAEGDAISTPSFAPSAQHVALLHELLNEAMTELGDGFATLQTTNSSAEEN
ncbi:TetR family transcriptional regulator [Glutamicibacter sp. PS]|uniref:TetR family transcriptional regulator n=1 Tax=Glutamicibacter sp. PS TaxID=3075634 RepID=UPI0028420C11|nr:TetR family transcriptional regulator [Glutamicibacter sp. PS]MDR4533573.1 TetR/AcrR family transcriptional regulator [Glutamicibacter sp. PS]